MTPIRCGLQVIRGEFDGSLILADGIPEITAFLINPRKLEVEKRIVATELDQIPVFRNGLRGISAQGVYVRQAPMGVTIVGIVVERLPVLGFGLFQHPLALIEDSKSIVD